MPTNNYQGLDGNANTAISWSLLHILLPTEDGTNSQNITSGTITGLTFTNSQVVGGATFNVSGGFVNTGSANNVTINGNVSGNGNYGLSGRPTINGNFSCASGLIGDSGVAVNGNTAIGPDCYDQSGFNVIFSGACSFNGGIQIDTSEEGFFTPGILYNTTGAKLAGVAATAPPAMTFPLS